MTGLILLQSSLLLQMHNLRAEMASGGQCEMLERKYAQLLTRKGILEGKRFNIPSVADKTAIVPPSFL